MFRVVTAEQSGPMTSQTEREDKMEQFLSEITALKERGGWKDTSDPDELGEFPEVSKV